jgi:hypothetical protein
MEAGSSRADQEPTAMPHRKRHLALVLILPILLALFAAPANAVPLNRAVPDLFSRGWSFLTSIWTAAGCSVDPYGRCGTSTAPEPILSDIGCSVDPFGLCGQ